ncbi:MAG: hypothetical protein ACMUJM_11550 [bacterium]
MEIWTISYNISDRKENKNYRSKDKVFEIIDKLIEDHFTGNLQLNFFKGGITNLNKSEAIILSKERNIAK